MNGIMQKEIIRCFDLEAETYGITAKSTGWKYMHRKVREKAAELCRASGGKLLDVGCGNGLFALELAKSFSGSIVGVDFSPGMLSLASKRIKDAGIKNVLLVEGAAQNLKFKDNTFDITVSVNALYNQQTADSFKGAVRELIRVCRPNGRIIFDIRNRHNPVISFSFKYNKSNAIIPLLTHTAGGIKELMSRENCIIRKIIPVLFPLLPPVILFEAEKISQPEGL